MSPPCIEKPFKNDDVLVVVRNAAAQRHLVTENRTLRQTLRLQKHRFSDLTGRSPRMKRVFDLISQAAPSRTTILVQGESGTGKELVARAIHVNSSRSDRPFITVNSGSLPPDLLESNLFGHVKGAFTGAVSLKKGLFELADQGSIFFDETLVERAHELAEGTHGRLLGQPQGKCQLSHLEAR